MTSGAPRQQHSWFQSSMLRYLVLPTSLAGILILLLDHTGCCIGDGTKDVAFSFVVIDAETGDPVGSATIRTFDSLGRRATPEDVVHSDHSGRARIVRTCRFTVHGSHLRGSGFVKYPNRFFEVSMEGYETTNRVLLTDQFGLKRDLLDPVPPPALIRLSPINHAPR
jgi:hypothetical protein